MLPLLFKTTQGGSLSEKTIYKLNLFGFWGTKRNLGRLL